MHYNSDISSNRSAFWRSAFTNFLNDGAPLLPFGAAKKVFAALLAYGFTVSPNPETRLIVKFESRTLPVPVTEITLEVPFKVPLVIA